jgi:hypothetical protein
VSAGEVCVRSRSDESFRLSIRRDRCSTTSTNSEVGCPLSTLTVAISRTYYRVIHYFAVPVEDIFWLVDA